MKAILEFNLPEDNFNYKLCNLAPNMHQVLWDFDQLLRGSIKYDHFDGKTLTEEERNFAEQIRGKWQDLLYENKIYLHEE